MSDRDEPRETPEQDGEPTEQPLWTVPPMSAGRIGRELLRDDLIRLGALVAAIAAMLVLVTVGLGGSLGAGVVAIVVLVGWVALSVSSAKVTRQLPEVTAMIAAAPDHAEDTLAQLLGRWGLLRSVRVLLYHRLAMLRHRQERFAEVAVLCDALVHRPLGFALDVRPHLLLMQVEAKLETGDLWGAWHALMELHRTRLTLIEALQRMALQTRYEVTIGRGDAALHAVQQKVELAELLPTAQCGAVHALLATAARARKQPQLAAWLWDRTQLLCSDAQLEQLAAGRFGLRVAHAIEDALPPVEH